MAEQKRALAETLPRPRRGAIVSSCAAMTFGLLAGCGTTEIELLRPRSNAGSPVSPSSPDGGPSLEPPKSTTDAGDGPAFQDAGPATDAGSSTCPPDTQLCEGFEANLAGWTFVRSDGTATATMLDSHTGMGSLELSTQSAGAFAYLERYLSPVSSGSLYLRAFLKIPADQVVGDYDVVLLSNAAADGGVMVSFAGSGVSLSTLAGSATAPGALAFPRDAWVCLEMALTPAAASVTSDLNGERDATLLSDDGFPAGGYERVAIGVVRASPTQMPTRILIDDVLIASSPIGCE